MNTPSLEEVLRRYQMNALTKLHNFYNGSYASKKQWRKLSKPQLLMKLEHILSGARKKTLIDLLGGQDD